MNEGIDNPNFDFPMFLECGFIPSIFNYNIRFVQWENIFYEGKCVDNNTILGEFVEYKDL